MPTFNETSSQQSVSDISQSIYYLYKGVYFEFNKFNRKQQILCYLAVLAMDFCIENYKRVIPSQRGRPFKQLVEMNRQLPLKERYNFRDLLTHVGEERLLQFEADNGRVIDAFASKISFHFR